VVLYNVYITRNEKHSEIGTQQSVRRVGYAGTESRQAADSVHYWANSF